MENYNRYNEFSEIDCCCGNNTPKFKKVATTPLPKNERKIIKIGR